MSSVLSDPRIDELVQPAIAGTYIDLTQLPKELRPVVKQEVTRALRRYAGRVNRDPRQEVADFVQDVFTMLLANDLHVLRS